MDSVDWASLRDNCAGDDGLVAEVIELFRTEAGAMLADIRTAVAARDANLIKRTAHRFKGALVSLAAKPATSHAQDLEKAGSQNDLAHVDGHLAALEVEFKKLMTALSQPVPRAA
jgi:HPt (histidine-containing phosphotransfer) domain-containing protein